MPRSVIRIGAPSGPVTRAGCGGLCPSYARACFACFGPADGANLPAMTARLRELGMATPDLVRVLRTVTVGAPAFARAAAEIEETP